MKKERIDALLVERGLAKSREEAKRLIMAGLVMRGTEVVDKPGTQIADDSPLVVKAALHPFVSRGGMKLRKALDAFDLSLRERIVLDVGASTGGFTDCALQDGAQFVYSVDVGYGQLAWTLRTDARVRVLERTNFRFIDPTIFEPAPDVAVMDVSFISVGKLLPKLAAVLKPDAWLITLIKPQFEAGPKAVGKGGIVREAAIHEKVLETVIRQMTDIGFIPQALTWSPIRGGEGNIEFLLYARSPSEHASSEPQPNLLQEINVIVAQAHAQL